jgi:hypothetical protein
MSRRPHVWKPWHAEPSPADDAVIRTPEELAEIEAADAERRKNIQKRATLPSARDARRNERRRMLWTNDRRAKHLAYGARGIWPQLWLPNQPRSDG